MTTETDLIDKSIAEKQEELKRLKAEKRFRSNPRLMMLKERGDDRKAIADAVYAGTKEVATLLKKYKHYSVTVNLIEDNSNLSIDIDVRLPMLNEQKEFFKPKKSKKKNKSAKTSPKPADSKKAKEQS